MFKKFYKQIVSLKLLWRIFSIKNKFANDGGWKFTPVPFLKAVGQYIDPFALEEVYRRCPDTVVSVQMNLVLLTAYINQVTEEIVVKSRSATMKDVQPYLQLPLQNQTLTSWIDPDGTGSAEANILAYTDAITSLNLAIENIGGTPNCTYNIKRALEMPCQNFVNVVSSIDNHLHYREFN